MRKTLLVITETSYDKGNNRFINPATETILRSYRKQFDVVHTLSPGFESGLTNFNEYYLLGRYSKKLLPRIAFLFGVLVNYYKIRALIKNYSHVQYRLPSSFVSVVLFLSRKENSSIYLSGDWAAAIRAMKRDYFFISTVFEWIVRKSIKDRVIITAGSALSDKYSDIAKATYWIISTTHNQCLIRKKNSDIIVVSFVGALTKLKGVYDIPLLIKCLKSKNINFKLNIIGAGPEEKLIENISQEYSCVVAHGQISLEKVNNILKTSDFLFHPSYSEGTPKVISEALSVGCIPIARHEIGSISDILNNRNSINLSDFNMSDLVDRIAIIFSSKHYEEYQDTMHATCATTTLDSQTQKIWKFIYENI